MMWRRSLRRCRPTLNALRGPTGVCTAKENSQSIHVPRYQRTVCRLSGGTHCMPQHRQYSTARDRGLPPMTYGKMKPYRAKYDEAMVALLEEEQDEARNVGAMTVLEQAGDPDLDINDAIHMIKGVLELPQIALSVPEAAEKLLYRLISARRPLLVQLRSGVAAGTSFKEDLSAEACIAAQLHVMLVMAHTLQYNDEAARHAVSQAWELMLEHRAEFLEAMSRRQEELDAQNEENETGSSEPRATVGGKLKAKCEDERRSAVPTFTIHTSGTADDYGADVDAPFGDFEGSTAQNQAPQAAANVDSTMAEGEVDGEAPAQLTMVFDWHEDLLIKLLLDAVVTRKEQAPQYDEIIEKYMQYFPEATADLCAAAVISAVIPEMSTKGQGWVSQQVLQHLMTLVTIVGRENLYSLFAGILETNMNIVTDAASKFTDTDDVDRQNMRSLALAIFKAIIGSELLEVADASRHMEFTTYYYACQLLLGIKDSDREWRRFTSATLRMIDRAEIAGQLEHSTQVLAFNIRLGIAEQIGRETPLDAMPILEKLHAQRPENAYVKRAMSIFLTKAQTDEDRALELAQQAVRALPTDQLSRIVLATILIKRGEKEDAALQLRLSDEIEKLNPYDMSPENIARLDELARMAGDVTNYTAENHEASQWKLFQIMMQASTNYSAKKKQRLPPGDFNANDAFIPGRNYDMRVALEAKRADTAFFKEQLLEQSAKQERQQLEAAEHQCAQTQEDRKKVAESRRRLAVEREELARLQSAQEKHLGIEEGGNSSS